MKTYRPLAVAARKISTDEQTLLEFQRAGWIQVVSKNGSSFVSGEDEYRSRFILHLRQKLNLTDEQIGIVLENGKAPYSLDQVQAILARHSGGG
jgi:cyanophycinase-like exopeptidase